MEGFAEDVRSGAFKGQGGRITDVVNIGIGGSDLGPAMATLALSPWHDGPRLHFVSNVDGAHLADVLKGLVPHNTLVLIASPSATRSCTLIGQNQNTPSLRNTRALKHVAKLCRIS